jgi:hypothetical protein
MDYGARVLCNSKLRYPVARLLDLIAPRNLGWNVPSLMHRWCTRAPVRGQRERRASTNGRSIPNKSSTDISAGRLVSTAITAPSSGKQAAHDM